MLTAWLLAALAASSAPDGGAAGPFAPGEQLSYRITILGAPAGTAQLSVGAMRPADGVPAWPIVAWARSAGAVDRVFPVHDRDVAWWDPARSRGVMSRLVAVEGSNRYGFVLHFRGGGSGLEADFFHWDLKKKVYKQLPLPEGTQDFLSAVYWLRTRPLALGERNTVPVYMGNDVWPLAARAVGRDVVTTPAGSIPCVHLVISAHTTGFLGNRRDLDAWFSDDPRHLPVLLDSELFLGHIRAILTQIEGADPR